MNVGDPPLAFVLYIKPGLTDPLVKCVATIVAPLDDIEMLVYLRSIAVEAPSVLRVAHVAP